jgi:hypothetical protein
VHYRPGEFVAAPKGTKFFVFESLEHANELRNSDYSWQLLPGRGEFLRWSEQAVNV